MRFVLPNCFNLIGKLLIKPLTEKFGSFRLALKLLKVFFIPRIEFISSITSFTIPVLSVFKFLSIILTSIGTPMLCASSLHPPDANHFFASSFNPAVTLASTPSSLPAV